MLGVVPRTTTTRVDSVAAHGGRARHAVQLVIQAASVAHHFAARVAPPDSSRVRAAVATGQLYARARAAAASPGVATRPRSGLHWLLLNDHTRRPGYTCRRRQGKHIVVCLV